MSGRWWFREQGEALAHQQDVADGLTKEFYNLKETAKLLERRYQDVRDMAAKGKIRTVEVGTKGQKRVSKKEIARLLAPTPMDRILDNVKRNVKNSQGNF